MFSDKFKFLGRVKVLEDKFLLKDSGSGISFHCIGSLQLTITPDKKSDKDSCPYLGIVLDDDIKNVLKLAVTDRLEDIEITNDDGESHKIDIIKLTEEQYGSLMLSDFSFENISGVKKAEELDKKILFIGDSITAGYGVEGRNGEGEFSTSEENVLGSAAVLTTRRLGAEVFVFAVSGNGIISRWISPDTDLPNKDGLMPDIFPFKTEKFPEPDYIVINLGTNDSSFVRGMDERKRLFENEYIRFIMDLRKLYPAAKIVVAYGLMETTLLASVKNAVQSYRERSADKNCIFVELARQKESEGIGAAGHPSVKINERAAKELAEAIEYYSQ